MQHVSSLYEGKREVRGRQGKGRGGRRRGTKRTREADWVGMGREG